MEDAILISYGGHAKSVADSIENSGEYRIIGYTDVKEQISPYRYLGTDNILEDYYRAGVTNLIMGIGFLGNSDIRKKLYDKYKSMGFCFPVVIDPSATISKTAEIGEGAFIGKGAVINAYAKIGKMTIINTKALVEHECIVEDFAHVSVGSVLCGMVVVEESAFVGANSTVIQGQRVLKNAIIPAGIVVR